MRKKRGRPPRRKKRKRRSYLGSHDLKSIPPKELLISCGTGAVFSSPEKDPVYGYIFKPTQELLSPKIAQNFLPDEEEVTFDPISGKPIVRQAKLDMTDYELRYMEFIFRMIRREGKIPSHKKTIKVWSKSFRRKRFTWLSRTTDGEDFLWSSQKIEAANLLAQGVPLDEVAKRTGRPKYAIQHWRRHDAFKMEVARRKLEIQEEYLERRDLEARLVTDTIFEKLQKHLLLVEHPHEKVSAKSLKILQTMLQEYRSFRDEERKNRGQATEIVKGTFDVLNQHRFTIDAVAKRLPSDEEKHKFLTKAGELAEDLSEDIAFDKHKDVIDADYEEVSGTSLENNMGGPDE